MTLDYQKVWNTMNELEMVTSKICSAREILDSAMNALENHKLEKTETLMYAVDEYLQYYLEEFDRKFKDAWKETVVKLNEVEQHSYLANDLLTQDRSSNFPNEQDPCMTPWGHSDLEYLSCNKDDSSSECKDAWNSFWEEVNYPEEYNGSTVSSVSDVKSLRYTDDKHSESYYDYTRNDSNRPNPFDKVVKWQLPVEEVENGDTMETEYFITFPDDLLQATNLNPGDEVEWVDRNDGSFLLRKVTKPLGMDEC